MRINSYFCCWMCNLVTNASLEDENTKFSHRKGKKCDKYGFKIKGKEDKVFRLYKTLYGLKQAPGA